MFLKEKIAVHIFLKFISIFIEKENEKEKYLLKNEIVNLKNEVEKLRKVVKKCEEEEEKRTVAFFWLIILIYSELRKLLMWKL